MGLCASSEAAVSQPAEKNINTKTGTNHEAQKPHKEERVNVSIKKEVPEEKKQELRTEDVDLVEKESGNLNKENVKGLEEKVDESEEKVDEKKTEKSWDDVLQKKKHKLPARNRDIKKEKEMKIQRTRTLTQEQVQWEKTLDRENPSNKYVFKVIKALDIFKLFSPFYRKEIIENWMALDAELKGYLSADDLTLLAEAMDDRIPDDQITRLVHAAVSDSREISENVEGKIFPRPYVKTMLDIKLYQDERRKWIEENFAAMDPDNQGFVPVEELRELMSEITEALTPERVDELIEEADIPDDGRVYEDDFIKLMNYAYVD